jgi:type II secretory pathway component PulJ
MIGRIAVASVLAVTLIAAVLVLTIWSYRSALRAHDVVANSISEQSNSHAAETYLAREREAMNEFLLNPHPSVRSEIRMYEGRRRRASGHVVCAPRCCRQR